MRLYALAPADAQDIRRLLRARVPMGLGVRERSHLLGMLTVFRLSGPAEALAAAREDYQRWRDQRVIDGAW